MTFEAGERSELLKGAFVNTDNHDAIIVWPGPAKGKAQIESTKLDVLEKTKASATIAANAGESKEQQAAHVTSTARLGPPGGPRLDPVQPAIPFGSRHHPGLVGESSLRTPLLIALRASSSRPDKSVAEAWLSSGRPRSTA